MTMFGPKECASCVLLKDENTYLRGLVKELQAKLLEVADPGANARLANAARLAAAPVVAARREKPHPVDEAVEAKRKTEQRAPLPGYDA